MVSLYKRFRTSVAKSSSDKSEAAWQPSASDSESRFLDKNVHNCTSSEVVSPPNQYSMGLLDCLGEATPISYNNHRLACPRMFTAPPVVRVPEVLL